MMERGHHLQWSGHDSGPLTAMSCQHVSASAVTLVTSATETELRVSILAYPQLFKATATVFCSLKASYSSSLPLCCLMVACTIPQRWTILFEISFYLLLEHYTIMHKAEFCLDAQNYRCRSMPWAYCLTDFKVLTMYFLTQCIRMRCLWLRWDHWLGGGRLRSTCV